MSRFVESTTPATSSYQPSFFSAGYINDTHRDLIDLCAELPGKLEVGDQLTLYEAGYFAQGAILEIGRLDGKSTTLLALGAFDAGNEAAVYSIDIDARHLPNAHAALDTFGLRDTVTIIVGRSAAQIPRLPAPFDTVFIDGDHSYEGVRSDLAMLAGRVVQGGVVMLHDYYHGANDTGDFGVRRAAEEAETLAFRRRSGAIAVFEQIDHQRT